MNTTLLILVLVTVQVGLLLTFFSRRLKATIQKNRLTSWITFFMLQGGFVVLLLAGGYGEERWQLFSGLKRFLGSGEIPRARTIPLVGDPGWIRFAESSKPALPRPDFSDPVKLHQWQSSARKFLRDSVFELGENDVPLKVEYRRISEEDVGPGLSRVLLAFKAFDGTEIPAYLFIPGALSGTQRPGPAVVVVPGHVRVSQSGIEQTAGIVDSYQHGNALRLAEAGIVALTFELRGFGELGPPFNTEHRLVAYNAILNGTFYKAIIAKDIRYAFDLLASLAGVDPERVGITGASYGGEMSVAYAALDERVKAVVFQAYGGTLGPRVGLARGNEKDLHYCRVIPGGGALFREDFVRLLAPRPVLGIRGREEHFKVAPDFLGAVEKAWETFGVPQNFELEVLPGGHQYFIEPAAEFLRKHL